MELVGTPVELGVKVGFFQNIAGAERRPVVDHAVGSGHHKYPFFTELRQWHHQPTDRHRRGDGDLLRRQSGGGFL
ncbi:hypothetical protein D3C78_1030470 [compost metagenome]